MINSAHSSRKPVDLIRSEVDLDALVDIPKTLRRCKRKLCIKDDAGGGKSRIVDTIFGALLIGEACTNLRTHQFDCKVYNTIDVPYTQPR